MPKKAKRVDRSDKWYVLAKEQGYRSRAAFKLAQINKEFNLLTSSTRVVLDLCAAPGGWAQVAAKALAQGSVVVAVDLLPIRPIAGVRSLVGDITTQETRVAVKREVRAALGDGATVAVDVALCDGAPNVGAAYAKDAFVQNEISLAALKCAVECGLRKGGAFATKVYRGKDYNALVWAFGRLFEKVRAFKPAASRQQSAEIFVVCEKYLAPSFVDPRLLDPRSVFADVADGDAAQSEAASSSKRLDVLHPKWGAKRRHRDGYADDAGVSLALPAGRVEDFVASKEPARWLADHSRIIIPDDDDDGATTAEVRACCEDLALLSRADMRGLLKWRDRLVKKQKLREPADDESSADDDDADDADALSEEDDEEGSEDSDAELSRDLAKARALNEREKRREKKREAKRTAKERKRRSAGILDESAIDIEAGLGGEVFSFGDAARAGGVDALEDADAVPADDDDDDEGSLGVSTAKESVPKPPRGAKTNLARYEQYASQRERDEVIESQLDAAFAAFGERRAQRLGTREATLEQERLVKKRTRDARAAEAVAEAVAELDGGVSEYVASLTRRDDDDDEGSSDEGDVDVESDDAGASKRWFANPVFDGLLDTNDAKEEPGAEMPLTEKEKRKLKRKKAAERLERRRKRSKRAAGDDDDALEMIMAENDDDDAQRPDEDDETDPKTTTTTRKRSAASTAKAKAAEQLIREGMGLLAPTAEDEAKAASGANAAGTSFEVVPVEAPMRTYDADDAADAGIIDYEAPETKAETMALATMMLRRSKAKALVDASYNRYAWNDPRDLPEWFTDDERRHYRPQLPIRPELAQEMRDKFKSLASKPIKKVAEARARKQQRAKARLAAAKAKAEAVAKDPDMSAGQKQRAVERALAKSARAAKIDKPGKVYVVQRKTKGGGLSKTASSKKSPGAKNARVKLVDRRLKKDKRADKARAKSGATKVGKYRKKKAGGKSPTSKKRKRS